MMRSQTSSVRSAMRTLGSAMPALLCAQSSRPHVCTAFSTIACTAAASVTSVSTKIASPPASSIVRTVSSPPSTAMSATTTFAPSAANACADALPMPELAPVTSATLPSNRPAIRDYLTHSGSRRQRRAYRPPDCRVNEDFMPTCPSLRFRRGLLRFLISFVSVFGESHRYSLSDTLALRY